MSRRIIMSPRAQLDLAGIHFYLSGDSQDAADRFLDRAWETFKFLAQSPRADEQDVVPPLRAQDLPDLAEQRVDVVAHSALAELAERGEIAPDLRRVDVRVVRDLLGRDPGLAHLLRLRQNLQVAAEPSRDADGQTIGRRRALRRSL